MMRKKLLWLGCLLFFISDERRAISASNSSLNEVERCLMSTDCWLEYNFKYDTLYNDCYGNQYVRYTGYSVGKLVGVVVCNNTKRYGSRYKIWLSDSITDTFHHIFDSSEKGQDHCEFVGGTDENVKLGPILCQGPPDLPAFYRGFYGIPPTFGKTDINTPWLWAECVSWYECGLNIPGNDTVVQYNGQISDLWDPDPFLPPDDLTRVRYTIDGCSVRGMWSGGVGTVSPFNIKNLSCVQCGSWTIETHVLVAYQPYTTSFTDKYRSGPITVYIKADREVIINLVLISYVAAIWNVNVMTDKPVIIKKIFQLSHDTNHTKVYPSQESPAVKINSVAIEDMLGMGTSYGSMDRLMDKLSELKLDMTTYMYAYNPKGFTITVGQQWNEICGSNRQRFDMSWYYANFTKPTVQTSKELEISTSVSTSEIKSSLNYIQSTTFSQESGRALTSTSASSTTRRELSAAENEHLNIIVEVSAPVVVLILMLFITTLICYRQKKIRRDLESELSLLQNASDFSDIEDDEILNEVVDERPVYVNDFTYEEHDNFMNEDNQDLSDLRTSEHRNILTHNGISTFMQMDEGANFSQNDENIQNKSGQVNVCGVNVMNMNDVENLIILHEQPLGFDED